MFSHGYNQGALRMMRRTLGLNFAWVVLVVLVNGASAQTMRLDKELAGRTVTLELVTDDENLRPVAWPKESMSLKSKTVSIKARDKVDALLKAEGFHADSEAYTLLYDLNPSVERLDLLPNGAKLVIPSLPAHEKIGRANVILLTVDKPLKDQLIADVSALVDLSTKFAALKSSQFADPDNQKKTISAVQEMVRWLSRMSEIIGRRTAKPMRRATLQQIVNEGNVLRLILELSVVRGARLSIADQQQLFALHDDLQETLVRWDEVMGQGLPAGEPQYNVVVEIRGNDAKLIKSLRVYYVVFGLFRKPPNRYSNFNGLGSGSSKILPIKKYKVWAAKDGDPANPVAEAILEVTPPPSGNTIPPLVLLLQTSRRQ